MDSHDLYLVRFLFNRFADSVPKEKFKRTSSLCTVGWVLIQFEFL